MNPPASRTTSDLSRRILVAIATLGGLCAISTAVLASPWGLAAFAYANVALVFAYVTLVYVLVALRPRADLKPATLTLVSVQCAMAVFSEGFAEVQLSAIVASLVAWLLMYHAPRALRIIGAAHVGAVALLLAFGPPVAPNNSWLSGVVFVFVALSFAAASAITIHSNRRYWDRMKRLEGELRRNEDSLRETAAQLSRQHAELSTTAAALKVTAAANAPQVEALRLAFEEQSRIAEAASSDLRQPLRNINQFVQLIRRRLTALGVADSVGDYLDFVTDGAARMNGMVDDLLRYSDAREEAAPAVPINTHGVLANIQDNLADLLAREGATLDFPTGLPTIHGHPTQVLQLFQNLISNGVKFKRPGVAPRCTIACVVEDGTARFSVSDNGIGIPANRLADVFGLFTRLHERGTYEGTGIGLATCRRIVMAAGGEIWAESVEGEGTTFCFTWPLEVGLSPKPAAAPQSEPALAA